MILYFIKMQISCSQLVFIQWLQGHLLPCPFKYITGIDCPGCGFQRAVLALMRGDFHTSFTLYPAAIPLLLFFIYGITGRFYDLDTKKEVIKKSGFIVIGTMILVSYCIKIYSIYSGHMVSI